MNSTTHETTPVIPLPYNAARLTVAVGAVATFASTFLAWTWTDAFPGDLTVTGYPGGLQILTLVGALVTLLFVAACYRVRGVRWATPASAENAVLYMALGTFATTWYTVVSIAGKLGGLTHLEPGAYLAAVASLAMAIGAFGLPVDRHTSASLPEWNWSVFGAVCVGSAIVTFMVLFEATDSLWVSFLAGVCAAALGFPLYWLFRTLRLSHIERTLPSTREFSSWTEILVIAAAFAVGLYLVTFGIATEYAELFLGFLLIMAFATPALTRAGLSRRLSVLLNKHRSVAVGAAFAAAFCFPFTQSSDTYTSVAANILIFSTVALGLNVVVGLAGLLDLGYVAFLGVGAYTAALVSGATSSSIGVQFPFWAAALTGAGASLVFGVVIGAPTLRLRGDYLAIVTLGFGEIFRLGMQNLDGKSGPDVTNGPNGITTIPDVEMFGFNFGESHEIFGFTIARFGNYYLLMLLVTAIVVTIFRRSDHSRIGRAWVAIREDETAARAMGINAFRFKLIAFALGATLAGLAGSVQAHVNYAVTPEQYKFVESVPPNSAFLLAAVILGGMGTVSGPLIGAALLYLIPYKLQFIGDLQLLLFGLALVLLMRFRPEGLIADRRKQLEFHETGQLDVPKDPELGLSKTGA